MSDVRQATERAHAGGPERHHEKSKEQGKIPVRERVERLLDAGLLRRGGAARQLGAGRPGRRRRRHRHGHDRRPARRGDGQRPDRQGRLLGPEDRREDHPHPGAGARAPGPDDLPRRLRGRPHHRPGADVPGPPRRRAHLPHRGQALGRRAADLRALRPQRRRRRLHPGLLRRRDHARGQRLDVPGLAAHGRDGHRREGLPRGDGRREDAHRRLGLRPLPRQDRRGGDRARQALPRATSPRTGRASRPPRRPPRRARTPRSAT